MRRRNSSSSGGDRHDVSGSSSVNDEDSVIVTNCDGVKEVWAEYLEKLLNVTNV